MPWWRKLLALLGLTEDARVRVRAPGIEVVITGDPDLAKKVLAAVKAEIAHQSAKRRGESVGAAREGARSIPAPPAQGSRKKKPGTSQVVRPSELDEMDSPYAIPEHKPVQADEPGDEELSGERTMNVDGMIESSREDGPEPEATAVDVANPKASAVPEIVAPSRQASRVGGAKPTPTRRLQADPTETE